MYRFLAPAVGVGLVLVCLIPVADFGGGNPCAPRPFAGAGVGLAVRLAEAETKLGRAGGDSGLPAPIPEEDSEESEVVEYEAPASVPSPDDA